MERLTLAVIVAALLVSVCRTSPAHGKALDTDFTDATFTNPTSITNPYWPLSSIPNAVYFSEGEDGCEVNEVTVTGDTRAGFAAPYDNLTAVVVQDREWVDEECDGSYVLVESTRDWYAQDDAGNIWYLGEATTAWDEDQDCLTTEGSWDAGQEGAEAGVVVPARPEPGLEYRQEYYEGVAEDFAKVLRLNARVSIGVGDFEGCLVTKEWSPLEPGSVEQKYYCPLSSGGAGLVYITEHHGPTQRVEYVGTTLPPGTFPETFPTTRTCPD